MTSEFVGEPQHNFRADVQARLATTFRLMFSNFDVLVQGSSWHAWYLGEVARDEEAPDELRAVAEFALRYHAVGIEEAIAGAQKDSVVPSGIPINVAIPHAAVERERPGLLVGLTDASYVNGQRIVGGVAAIKNSEGNWAFVNVAVGAGGDAVLLSEDRQRHDPDTEILLMELNLGASR